MKLTPTKCLVLLLSFFLSTPSLAQQWAGALKIGVSAFTFSGAQDPDPRTALAGGMALGYDFGNGIIIQPELLYITKGASADRAIGAIPVRVRSNLTYVDIPLLFQYRLNTPGTVHPKIFVGPSISFLLNATIDITPEGSNDTSREVLDDATTFDYGVVAGIGAEIEISGQRLVLEGRAFFGQTNAREDDPPINNVGGIFFLGIAF